MKKLLTTIKWTSLFILLFSVIAIVLIYINFRTSLPVVDGTITFPELQQPVQVELDNHAIPTISAKTDLDAFKALGYLTARERLFQMDLMRRKSAGRLSEIFGKAAVEIDIQQRHLQLERAAQSIKQHLPKDQLDAIHAYVAGVNTAITQIQTLPFEFLVLRYKPELWRVEDSLLVALSMFQVLSSAQESERMLSVMQQALPSDVIAFLTPDVDQYESVLTGGNESWRPQQPIPVEALSKLLSKSTSTAGINSELPDNQNLLTHSFAPIRSDDIAPGSNGWAVAGSKTKDNRAILANDMHLPLRVPNIWYRATIKYTGHIITGVTLPGLPLMIAGTNNHIAWGYTNAYVDLVDLVKIEINPKNPNQYRSPEGWENFKHHQEQIITKDEQPTTIDIRSTRWGPISQRTLLGSPVALKWTALDPLAVNLGLLYLHTTTTLEQAVKVMNNAGGPPQNAMLADNSGRIAWTLMGKIPKRRGFDGSISHSWANDNIGWIGYLEPDLLPRVIDPASGFLATANNRTIGKAYPFKLGHNSQASFRAWRINQRLQQMHSISEQDMLGLQLDTHTEFYRYYQNLALSVLTPSITSNKPSRKVLRDYLASWDGKAEINSTGFPVLFEFRKALALAILPSYYQYCLAIQTDFKFSWSKKETPIRQLLNAKIPATLPQQNKYASWDALILDTLEHVTNELQQKYQINNLNNLTWGRVNIVKNSHPFSYNLPILGSFLDMPQNPLSGCPYCVRVVYGQFGASERFAVSPGHLEQGIIHMPTGQSGHPLSGHYADQQSYWEQGKALPFISRDIAHQFELVPLKD